MSILKRAVIKAYNPGTHRASVQMAESLSVWLDGLVVATDIAAADVVPGRDCTVLLFTDDNPDDGVIVTVHGALPSAPPAGDHHLLTNLNTNDDHPRYAQLAGRSGGQGVSGDTLSHGALTLPGTPNGTPGAPPAVIPHSHLDIRTPGD